MLSPNIPEPFDHQQAARNAIGLAIGREFQALLSSYFIGCLDCYFLNQEELWNLSTLMRELQSLLEVGNDFQALEQWLNSGFVLGEPVADNEILLPKSSAASAGIDSAFSSSQLELEKANPRLFETASSWESWELPASVRQDSSMELVEENTSPSQLEAPTVKNLKDLVQRLALKQQRESFSTSASVNLRSDRVSEVDIAEGDQNPLLDRLESLTALSVRETGRVSPEPFDHQQTESNTLGLAIGREFQSLLSSYAIGCLDCYSLNQESRLLWLQALVEQHTQQW